MRMPGSVGAWAQMDRLRLAVGVGAGDAKATVPPERTFAGRSDDRKSRQNEMMLGPGSSRGLSTGQVRGADRQNATYVKVMGCTWTVANCWSS